MRLVPRASLSLVLLSNFMVLSAMAAQESDKQTGGAKPIGETSGKEIILHGGQPKEVLMLNGRAQQKEERLAKANKSMLHRLDFRVEGSGCAACLGRVRKRIDKLTGVIEVAVAIKKPYGVAVIYDAGKLSQEKILKEGKEGEAADIKFIDIDDVKIDFDKLPIVLVPKFNNLLKKD